jgi:translation initiation factor IF-2
VPGKTRVSALAKELGLPSKVLIEWLNENGEYVKTASSTIEAPAVRKAKEAFPTAPAAEAPAKKAPAKKAAPAEAAAPAAVQPVPTVPSPAPAVPVERVAGRARPGHAAAGARGSRRIVGSGCAAGPARGSRPPSRGAATKRSACRQQPVRRRQRRAAPAGPAAPCWRTWCARCRRSRSTGWPAAQPRHDAAAS